MSDVTVTVRMPKEMRDQLAAIGEATQRSKSFLAKMAIGRFVETEAEIIEGIKEAQAQLRAGLGIPHAEVMRQSKLIVEKAAARKAN
jgi:predicted transcriptional regulator